MPSEAPVYRSPSRSRWVGRLAKRLFYLGGRRYCVVCGSSVRVFKPYGHVRRPDAQCPVCGCVERHRFTWRFFEARTDLFDGKRKKMLHVAPEPEFERRLRGLPRLEYLSLDPQDRHADLSMNLENLEITSDEFDVIHCSHVLEHVSDDRAAMRELARVLSPSGWATILVPIIREETFEDPSVVDPAERARLFGQWDHVRAYGNDFVDRLEEAGFSVTVVRASDLLSEAELETKYRFADEQLFLCRKRAASPSS